MNTLTPDPKHASAFTQVVRYAVVGIVSNCGGYAVYLLATYWGGTPKITMSILYAVGAAIGFLGNRQITFGYKGSILGAGARYVMAQFLGYSIDLAILVVFVDRLGFPHQVVQAVAVTIVAAFLFLTFRYYVFADLKTE